MFINRYLASHMSSETATQATKYLIVGGICTLLDFALLFFFAHFFGINYIVSSVFSFMAAVVLNYFLCISWIFKVRVIENRHHEFFYYVVISAVGLAINTLFIWGLTQFLGIHFMLSKVAATFIIFAWNFGARKYFLHAA